MTILTNIPLFAFSTELPETITISTNEPDAVVRIDLYVGDSLEWTNELFANNNKAYLYDIRQIIELLIRAHGEVLEVCSMNVYEGEAQFHTGQFTVILSDRNMPSANNWLMSHFLSTRTIQVINRHGKQRLLWAVYQSETAAQSIIATVENAAGQMQDITWIKNSSRNYAEAMYSFNVNVEEIEAHFASSGILRAFTVQQGNRSMKFFVVDEEPQMLVLIYNNFNADEFVPLWGVTIEKNKLEASEAQYMRNKVKYDFEINQEFEFESALVSKEEGVFLAQLYTSKRVMLVEGSTQREILIDGECEVSDSNAAENRIKFTYKFANS